MKAVSSLLILIAIIAINYLYPSRCAAQLDNPVTWSPATNISDTPAGSWSPTIVADSYGYVHVFWVEDLNGQPFATGEGGHNPNTLLYRRWNGSEWSYAIDPLFLPGESIADFPALAVGPDNHLHIVWTGLSNIYYSNAPASNAISAIYWSKPVILTTQSARSQHESSVSVDRDGTVHIAYATRGPDAGVYYVSTHDNGLTWTTPVRISLPLANEEVGFSTVQIMHSEERHLHIVYQTYQNQGFGQAIYYVRSPNGGETWEAPLQIAIRKPDGFTTEWPYLAVRNGTELHLVYVDGPNSIGRFHRISRDNGNTWSEPRHILTDLMGVTGYSVLLVDSKQNLHLLVLMRYRDTQQHGVYWTSWYNDAWSPLVPVVTDGLFVPRSHRLAATINLGNEIHLVFWSVIGNDLDSGDIWHIKGVLQKTEPLQRLDPAPVSSVSVTKRDAAVSTPVPQEKESNTQGKVSTGTVSSPIHIDRGSQYHQDSMILFISLLPSLILIIGVLFIKRRSRRL